MVAAGFPNPTSGDVCRDLDSPDGVFVNGAVHPRAAAGNLVLCNCLRIIRAALAHDAAFILESPVSRASGSPYAIAGREKHASMWDTVPPDKALSDIFSGRRGGAQGIA
eukprot:scaffold7111_cov126-Isochrysis_galbana.AAC.2